MAYRLSNKGAKNLCKRTVLVQLIIKNVVTCFLEHNVQVCIRLNERVLKTENCVNYK